MSQLVELTVEECLDLLRTHTVGRIALNTPAGLRILPVNYAVHDDAIVFRTVPYGEIANHVHEADVAFEIDHLDEEHRGGWSVLAVGRCRRIEDPGEVRMMREAQDPGPWAAGQRVLWFRIDWQDLTGRQLGTGPRPTLQA